MAEKRLKGSRIKTIIIIILLVIMFLWYISGSLRADDKRNFWIAVTVIGTVVAIIFFFSRRGPSIDVWKIAENLINEEYRKTGKILDISNCIIDVLDANTLLFSFESGELISYKYSVPSIPPNIMIGRLYKKNDSIKDEIERRSVFKAIAQDRLRKDTEKKMAEKAGFEIVEEDEE